MRVSRLVCIAAGVAASAAMLSACTLPSAQGGPARDDIVPPVVTSAHHASWMEPRTSGEDLLYVTNGNGIVNVYTYSQQELVGELINFTDPKGECTDAKADVYITDYGADQIDEYAHGGTSPLRVIDESGYKPYNCAIDPKTGDLAVANYTGDGYESEGNLAIYARAKGKPTYYSNADLYYLNACGYDKFGDLLATGFTLFSGTFLYTAFAYLPAKSKDFAEIALPPPDSSFGWDGVEVQGIGWDGKYWAVEPSEHLYEYSINIKPELVGSVELEGADSPIAFYGAAAKKQATQAIGSDGFSGSDDVYYWSYPAGGEPLVKITHGLDHPFGVAISLGKVAIR